MSPPGRKQGHPSLGLQFLPARTAGAPHMPPRHQQPRGARNRVVAKETPWGQLACAHSKAASSSSPDSCAQ